MDGSSEYLTTTRAAELLGSSAAYIRQLHRQGKLPCDRVEGTGGRPGPRLFVRRHVEELIVKRVAKHLQRAL